jgi:O-antigen/teichoic acid export membrane protein
VVRGVAWMAGARLVVRGLGFVSALLLARLLLPADFGVVAVATSMVAFLELLTAFGFDTALIQRQSLTRQDLDTVWTLTLIFSVGVGLLLCLLAGPASDFYRDARLSAVMIVIGLNQMLSGFANVGTVFFRRDLDFRRDFLLQVSAKVAGFFVAVPLAFVLRNHWALVMGMVASNVAAIIVSYAIHWYRPRLSLGAAREMFGFSVWLLLNNVLGFLRSRSIDLIIGRAMGTRSVGLFTLSYELAGMATTELIAPINRVSYPAYVAVAQQPAALERAFAAVLGMTALVGVPVSVGIAAAADLAVPALLGERWLAAVPLVVALGFYSGLSSVQTNTGSLFNALGKPHLISAVAATHVCTLVPLLVVVATRGSLEQVAWVFAIHALVIGAPVTFWMVLRETPIGPRAVASGLWRPVLGSAAMYGSVRWLIESGVSSPDVPVLARLAVAMAAGCAVYVLAVGLLWALCGRPSSAEERVIGWIEGVFRKRLRA